MTLRNADGGWRNGCGFIYRPQVVAELAGHGVIPRKTTDPALVHEFVNDLYRYELRKLRGRLMRQQVAKPAYADHVIALRKKYTLVSVPLGHWTVPSNEGSESLK